MVLFGSLEKLQNELDGAKMEIHHLKEREDGLKHKIMELQIEIKKDGLNQKGPKWTERTPMVLLKEL